MFAIYHGMKVSAAQTVFSNAFPFLKLEFFRHGYKIHGANARKDLIKPESKLKSIDGEDHICIHENMSVYMLEQLFSDHFGLSVQVFRKLGKAWIETTLTNDWTLKKQNEEGMELSSLK